MWCFENQLVEKAIRWLEIKETNRWIVATEKGVTLEELPVKEVWCWKIPKSGTSQIMHTGVFIWSLGINICVFILTFRTCRMQHKVNFTLNLTSFISGFSFFYTHYHTKFKDLSLPYYLTITGGRIVGFIPFL